MKKIVLLFLLCSAGIVKAADIASLPPLSDQQAIQYDYFPSRLHCFIWRNWTIVPQKKLAEVLGTTEDNVQKTALSMGLRKQGKIDSSWTCSKGYITTLRRNWHLLPYSQLEILLGMSEQVVAW